MECILADLVRTKIKFRSYLADTVALVIFSTVGGAIIELLVVGLSFSQTFWVRLGAIPIMLVAGRPYGIFRDLVFRGLRVRHGQRVRAAVADTIANVAFQVPVYALLLYANGATITQIISAIYSVIIFITVSGRPYGMFLDCCRALLDVSAAENGPQRGPSKSKSERSALGVGTNV
jgi:hypothetical protein